VVELIFMMLVLKLPLIYLGLVCWWAIRAEPKPLEPALLPVEPVEPAAPSGWRRASRPRRPGPHGGPVRSYARTRRTAATLP
jgi:hypothetical protein